MKQRVQEPLTAFNAPEEVSKKAVDEADDEK
jgi:hypothetical protein